MNITNQQHLPPLCDFKKYERFSPEILGGLEQVQILFASKTAEALKKDWGLNILCRPLPLIQSTPRQFLNSLTSPSLLAQIDISPYYRPLWMALDASILAHAIAFMLKQPVNKHIYNEKLNSLERALALKFIRNLLDNLKACSEKFQQLSFTVRQLDYGDPKLRTATRYRGYLLAPLLIEGDSEGMLHFALPYDDLTELQDHLPNHDNNHQPLTNNNLQDFPVEVRAVMSMTKISSADLATLTPGDLLLFQQDASTRVELKVSDVTIATGNIGLVGEYKGVQL